MRSDLLPQQTVSYCRCGTLSDIFEAYGVYVAARERGLRIPEDVSVVGFDDVDLCRWVTPQLTTMRQPLAEMAAEATRLVLALARGERAANTRVQFEAELVVRGSTGPAA